MVLGAIFSNDKGAWGMPFMILLYPLMGFVGGMIAAAIYNVVSKIVGGLSLELDGEIVDREA